MSESATLDTENKVTEDISAGVGTAGPTAQPETRKFVSHGYRIHNELTYRVIDWLLNSTFGVATTYWSARTQSGERIFNKPVSNFFKVILKPVLKNESTLIEGAKWGSRFTSIMVGGFAIIPPMMFMENKERKKKMVRWLDEKIYGKDIVAGDPKFQQSYDKIDEEPKKGFMSGIGARLLALAPLLVITFTPKANMQVIKYAYDPIGKATKWTAENILRIKPQSMMTKGALEHLDGNPGSAKEFQSNWDFLHRTIGFDFGLTFLYSFMHEIAYKFLAAFSQKKEQKNKVPAEPLTALNIAPATETQSAPDMGKWTETIIPAAKSRPERTVSHVQAAESRMGTEQPTLA